MLVLWMGIFSSCQRPMKEYYEEPEWLKGSIYEILSEKGNYQLFLQGVDLCHYTGLLQGRSILTVMAPDDEAMKTYLMAQYGTSDLTSVPLAEVKKLIGFHILYYSFDRNKMLNFRPSEGDGATEVEKEKNAGMYYKFRTRSQDAPEQVVGRIPSASGDGTFDTARIDVYHLERFIPVFSPMMFQTKLIDAKYNYEYFFPSTPWNGQADGFNVADALVEEYGIIAKNGYLYLVDRCIRPLETIHRELESNPQYSQYLFLYDQYGYYTEDETLTSLYGGGSKVYYQQTYDGGAFSIPNIALEWPVSDYSAMTALSSTSFSVFAPTNEAFDEFYRSYWGDEGTGYPAEVCYDSVSSDAIGYLLSNSFYSKSIVFPDEIKRGDIQNEYTKTVIRFDVDQVPQENRKMCVNGVLYGQSLLTPPAVFGSVTGPAYKYRKYSIFLKMLTASNMQQTLTSDAVRFIMLYPDNHQFESNYIWYDAATDKLKSGVPGSTAATNLSSSAQSKYVNAHTVSLENGMEALPMSGLKVFRTLSTDYKLYWYVKDGKITNSFKYNSLIHYAGHQETTLDSVYVDFQELDFRGLPWSNGHCYRYDTAKDLFVMEGSNDNYAVTDFVPMMYLHRNEENTLFHGFIRVLLLADMMDEQAQTMNYMTENCLMLVPTTEAVCRAIADGRFPFLSVSEGTQPDDPEFWSKVVAPVDGSAAQDSLQKYLLQYFLPESTSPCADYPYPGWTEDTEADGGIFSISDISGVIAQNVTVQIYDRNGQLTAKVDGMDREVPFYNEYDCLPFVFDDGCVQFLNGIFDDCWPGHKQ